jgi:glycerol kinase
MQFQADILDMRVVRPKILESTAMGAGYLAGLGEGIWESIDDIEKLWQEDKAFAQNCEKELVEKWHSGWKKALDRSKGWN